MLILVFRILKKSKNYIFLFINFYFFYFSLIKSFMDDLKNKLDNESTEENLKGNIVSEINKETLLNYMKNMSIFHLND